MTTLVTCPEAVPAMPPTAVTAATGATYPPPDVIVTLAMLSGMFALPEVVNVSGAISTCASRPPLKVTVLVRWGPWPGVSCCRDPVPLVPAAGTKLIVGNGLGAGLGAQKLPFAPPMEN